MKPSKTKTNKIKPRLNLDETKIKPRSNQNQPKIK